MWRQWAAKAVWRMLPALCSTATILRAGTAPQFRDAHTWAANFDRLSWLNRVAVGLWQHRVVARLFSSSPSQILLVALALRVRQIVALVVVQCKAQLALI